MVEARVKKTFDKGQGSMNTSDTTTSSNLTDKILSNSNQCLRKNTPTQEYRNTLTLTINVFPLPCSPSVLALWRLSLCWMVTIWMGRVQQRSTTRLGGAWVQTTSPTPLYISSLPQIMFRSVYCLSLYNMIKSSHKYLGTCMLNFSEVFLFCLIEVMLFSWVCWLLVAISKGHIT